MTTVPRPTHPGNHAHLLTLVRDRAKAAFPTAVARIDRGLRLVLNDAVTDMTGVTPGQWLVASDTVPGYRYSVRSTHETTCTCPDWLTRSRVGAPYLCKHGFAVLLVRALRRELAKPQLRHAYHAALGDEGHARLLADGRAVFHPGGHRHSVVCATDDLYLGPMVQA